MHIALLSNFTKHMQEATNITLLDLSKHLKKKGYEISIVSEGRDTLPKQEIYQSIPVYRLYNLCFLKLANIIISYVLTARQINKRKKIDVLHSFSSSPFLVLRSLLSRLFIRAKVVHTIKSYPKSKHGLFFTRILNFADMITVPTKCAAKQLMQRGCKKKKIKVIHSHINTKKFHPMNKSALKKKYGYNKKKMIFYYGPLRYLKGVDDLLKALPKVKKSMPNTVVVFAVRGGGYHAKYDKIIKDFGLSGMVRIIIKEVDIVEYVNMADVLVLAYPSLRMTEGNPSCMLEAMACKTPVITTRLPELTEIVAEEVEFVRPGNILELAEKMIQVLKKPNKTKILKAYNRAQDFSVEKVAREFVRLYESL